MEGRTRAMADTLYHPLCRRDIKGPTGAHRHFADIGAGFLALRHHRTHDITRLIALHPFGLLGGWYVESQTYPSSTVADIRVLLR